MRKPKRFLVLQTGDTIPSVRTQHGGFEQMYTQALRLGEGSSDLQIETIDLTERTSGAGLPDPREFTGIVMTGSAAMLGENTPWMQMGCRYLETVLKHQAPFLGVCFGHQMLGQVAGGQVGPNPHGREMGTVRVYLNEQTDPFFTQFPNSFLAQVTHVDVVLERSSEITSCGQSAHDGNHMIHVGPHAYGVQFHPEFSHHVISAYLRDRQAIFDQERGSGTCQLRLETVRETPFAARILALFREHAQSIQSR